MSPLTFFLVELMIHIVNVTFSHLGSHYFALFQREHSLLTELMSLDLLFSDNGIKFFHYCFAGVFDCLLYIVNTYIITSPFYGLVYIITSPFYGLVYTLKSHLNRLCNFLYFLFGSYFIFVPFFQFSNISLILRR